MSDAPVEDSKKGGRRGGPWLAHVKKTMRSEAGLKAKLGKKWFSHVLKSAKKSYHKNKKGGEDSASDEEKVDPAMGGRRRRRGGKTRRHRK
jgi:hypothetical protein